jgi:hypothetical protein
MRQPFEQGRHLLGMLRQMRAADPGDREQLLGAFCLLLGDMIHVIEHGQRWVDDAGARGISAAGPILDLADQVVAVARLFLDQLEQDEAQFAPVEHPPAASAFATRMAEGTSEPATPKAARAAIAALVMAVLVTAMMKSKSHVKSLCSES